MIYFCTIHSIIKCQLLHGIYYACCFRTTVKPKNLGLTTLSTGCYGSHRDVTPGYLPKHTCPWQDSYSVVPKTTCNSPQVENNPNDYRQGNRSRNAVAATEPNDNAQK